MIEYLLKRILVGLGLGLATLYVGVFSLLVVMAWTDKDHADGVGVFFMWWQWLLCLLPFWVAGFWLSGRFIKRDN